MSMVKILRIFNFHFKLNINVTNRFFIFQGNESSLPMELCSNCKLIYKLLYFYLFDQCLSAEHKN